MKLTVLQDLPKRLSIAFVERVPRAAAPSIERSLQAIPGVRGCTLRYRAQRLAIEHDGKPQTLRAIASALAERPLELGAGGLRSLRGAPAPSTALTLHRKEAAPGRALSPIVRATAWFLVGRLAWGVPRILISVYGAIPFLRAGLRSLARGRLDASTLDATAIGSALLSRNYATAGLISYLLKLGNAIEDLTEARSETALAALVDKEIGEVWVSREGVELKVEKRDLVAGDTVIVRGGYVVPADGEVIEGQAMINEAVLTGEAWPHAVGRGARVHEGSVVTEGRLSIQVKHTGEETRLSQMLRIIGEAKQKKAGLESTAQRLADASVPYVLLGAAVSYLLTGDPTRAAAALLVDYSCALRLTIPIVFRSGMLEAGSENVLIKGGKSLEALSRVNTVVFDKTGTLTRGSARVIHVEPMNGYSTEYVLKNSACVEEHFTHPISSAIVQAARDAGLDHVVETHGEIQYLVSYGIVSSVAGKRFIVGGERVLAANGIDCTTPSPAVLRLRDAGYSLVYVVVDKQLAGVMALDDELHGEARRTVERLRALGMKKIMMLTGDTRANALRVARATAIEDYRAELLPEEKVELIHELRERGNTVAMLGDGLNDGPAISAADVGISLASGADLSREVADVVLLAPTLELLPETIEVARATMRRARRNFGYVLAINSTVFALGLFGLLGPTRTAFLHNMSTVVLSLNAARRRLAHA